MARRSGAYFSLLLLQKQHQKVPPIANPLARGTRTDQYEPSIRVAEVANVAMG